MYKWYICYGLSIACRITIHALVITNDHSISYDNKKQKQVDMRNKAVNTTLLFSSWTYVSLQLVALLTHASITLEDTCLTIATAAIVLLIAVCTRGLINENQHAWTNRTSFKLWHLLALVFVFAPLAAALPAVICQSLIDIMCEAGVEIRPVATWDVFIAMYIFMIQLYRMDYSVRKTLGHGYGE